MDRIRIRGGHRLNGVIAISGAKNAALPLMAAALLTDDTLSLTNVPHLADIATMADLLATLGCTISMDGNAANGGHDGHVLALQAKKIASTTAPYDLVRKMRASVLVLGPLVARKGKARVSMPGGCAIGNRPVDLHLKGSSRSAPRSSSPRAISRRARPRAASRAAISCFRSSRSARPKTCSWRRAWRTANPCCRMPRASRRSPIWPTAWSPWAPRSPASAPTP